MILELGNRNNNIYEWDWVVMIVFEDLLDIMKDYGIGRL